MFKKHQVILPGIPGLKRLLSYQRAWLLPDILAGVTVAAYLIPQCMAYGELAGVQPVVGLWAILPPMIIYALLGSSPQLSVGPESTTAVMTAAAIAPLVASNGSNYASLASVLAFMVGIVCIIGYIARLGFLADLLSKPILVGYMAGVAVIMITGQLGKIGGIKIEANTVFGEVGEFFSKLDQIHQPTLILAAIVLAFLFIIQRRFPTAPGPLLAVLLATASVALFHLEQQGVAVVKEIPAGLPHLTLPKLSTQELSTLVASAIGIAIVGYSDNVLTARAFASRNHYKIDANQELLALGTSNLGNGLMQGFPISSSGSRTAIADSLGSKSQAFSLVALVIVILVLLFLRPLLAEFPKAALGAIVIYAATKLIEIPEFLRLTQFRRSELFLAVATIVGVLFTDILVGVGIAVGLSVIDLFARVARPHDAVLGEVPDLPGLHDIEDWEGAKTIPGLVIYRYDAPLCFANVEHFKRRALSAIEAEKTPVEWFVLNTEAIVEVDITAIDALAQLHSELAAKGITFAMTRVKQDLYKQLKRSQLLQKIGSEHIYFTLHTALAAFQARDRHFNEQSTQSE
ncbi:solute carrier family 26 protein [Nostoc sp. CENA67]|uniref:Solute carrier family 26 protein n=1 Tax=Amazonocrinis nigriterrae CENA67 TaxID=2794033 RepID=A0A8J7LAB9_9NOST|nr:solute carrier family 26 protein [Amazonocrinis nigriterrae]MBH8562363.1 solute carrier family 26 protein [Amazonocrinis nigriterrae CENA67]MBH8562416.1 solute carrier family 26 protein [Amazonocrinis nigriterrae CENA67]